MPKKIVWKQYRDESKRSLPQKLGELMKQYKAKTGRYPTVIGLLPNTDGKIVAKLRERFDVRMEVPRWAPFEIWLGIEKEESLLEVNNASL